jgi:hypothetical protein
LGNYFLSAYCKKPSIGVFWNLEFVHWNLAQILPCGSLGIYFLSAFCKRRSIGVFWNLKFEFLEFWNFGIYYHYSIKKPETHVSGLLSSQANILIPFGG